MAKKRESMSELRINIHRLFWDFDDGVLYVELSQL